MESLKNSSTGYKTLLILFRNHTMKILSKQYFFFSQNMPSNIEIKTPTTIFFSIIIVCLSHFSAI